MEDRVTTPACLPRILCILNEMFSILRRPWILSKLGHLVILQTNDKWWSAMMFTKVGRWCVWGVCVCITYTYICKHIHYTSYTYIKAL